MTTPMPPIGSRADWQNARADLLIREKELTRLKDSVSAARRRLPMVEITEPYTLDTRLDPRRRWICSTGAGS
jgi:predicted dithiol-disulfide oxidoreductase (DUF899 family)